MERLTPQLRPDVELLTFLDDAENSIGAKRQSLLERASGEFVGFIDDDDLVSTDYLAQILPALTDDVDIVGFVVRLFIAGKLRGFSAHTRTDYRFNLPREQRGCEAQTRLPNHLNPIRREIALQIGFQPWNRREDGDYTKRLHAKFPNLRERFIPEVLYDYLLRIIRDGEITNANRHRSGAVAVETP